MNIITTVYYSFIFIIYGSLLPFEYRQVSLDDAWSHFVNIPYLELDIVSRADWIANILIYIPLSFFSLAWLVPKIKSVFFKIAAICTILLGCSATAMAIEFCQIFISPRTVSLNDIIAEMIGISLGLVFWLVLGRQFLGYCVDILKGGTRAMGSALVLYGLFYLALCLFPFDFIVSSSDLAWKLSSGQYALIVLPSAFDRPLYSLMSLGIEVLLAVPLGILILINGGLSSGRLFKLLLVGGFIGILIEGVQLFLASGVSQGISVLTRVMGVGLGGIVLFVLQSGKLSRLRPYSWYLVLAGALPYVWVLLSVNDFFSQAWIGYEEAVLKLERNMFLPFYYHYFSTETQAVLSLLYNMALYAPIGAACWILGHIKAGEKSICTASFAAVLAGGAACIVEVGKLGLTNKHPDFTNVMIAAAGAGLVFVSIEWGLRVLKRNAQTSMMSHDVQG